MIGGYSGGYNYGIQPQVSNTIMCVIVQSEDEVNRYLVAANSTVMLLCFNTGRFYLKGTDANGIQLPLRVFQFSENTPARKEEAQPEYATKADLEQIKELIKTLGGAQNGS